MLGLGPIQLFLLTCGLLLTVGSLLGLAPSLLRGKKGRRQRVRTYVSEELAAIKAKAEPGKAPVASTEESSAVALEAVVSDLREEMASLRETLEVLIADLHSPGDAAPKPRKAVEPKLWLVPDLDRDEDLHWRNAA